MRTTRQWAMLVPPWSFRFAVFDRRNGDAASGLACSTHITFLSSMHRHLAVQTVFLKIFI